MVFSSILFVLIWFVFDFYSSVNELQVRNLNAVLITNDTVVLRWTADKRGRHDVHYIIDAQSMGKTPVVIHEDTLTGLSSETQYNFSVISVLPADDLYDEMTVTSEVISIWTSKGDN